MKSCSVLSCCVHCALRVAVAVICDIAEGNKCSRSWKILPEVGTDKEYPDLSLRDADVMREINDKGN